MKRVALINDLSGLGKCSLTAAIPVISVMGMQACPLPTAVLSCQTGFEQFFVDDYTDRMNEITTSWELLGMNFDGIYSGYLGNAAQIENVLFFLDRFYKNDTIFLADPIMGDNGKKIKSFTDELLETMKCLTRRADVITPNLTEACLLSGSDYDTLIMETNAETYLKRISDIAARLREAAGKVQTVIITGILVTTGDIRKIGNLISSGGRDIFLESEYTGKSFSGTGDLFASVVTGGIVSGMSPEASVAMAMDFMQPAIEEATSEDVDTNHGIMFEKYLGKLININTTEVLL